MRPAFWKILLCWYAVMGAGWSVMVPEWLSQGQWVEGVLPIQLLSLTQLILLIVSVVYGVPKLIWVLGKRFIGAKAQVQAEDSGYIEPQPERQTN